MDSGDRSKAEPEVCGLIKPLSIGGRAVFATVIAIGVVVAALCVADIVRYPLGPSVAGYTLLSAFTIAFALFTLRLPGLDSLLSLSDTCVFLAVLLYGPAPAALLAGAEGVIGAKLRTKRWLSACSSGAILITSAWVAGAAYHLLLAGIAPRDGSAPSIVQRALPIAAMGIAHWLVNSFLVATLTAVARRATLLRTWRENYLWTVMNFLAGASAAGVVALLIENKLGLAAIVTALPIVLGTYVTYRVFLGRVETEHHKLTRANELHLKTLEALAAAIDARNQSASGHLKRAQSLAIGLADKTGVDDTTLEAIRTAVLLHDIGKLAIPDYILNKPAALSPAESRKLRTYPRIGAEILAQIGFPYPVAPIVKAHREWWNGEGYPDGVAGAAIPIGARIIAVADAVDTMLSGTNRAAPMTVAEVLAHLTREAGQRFDPKLVACFIEHHVDLLERAQEVAQPSIGGTEEIATIQREHARSLFEQQEAGSALSSISAARREEQTLIETARELSGALDLDAVFAILGKQVRDLVPHHSFAVCLAAETTGALSIAHAEGFLGELLADNSLRLADPAVNKALGQRGTTFLRSGDPELQDLASHVPGWELAALLTPLQLDDRCVGVLAIFGDPGSGYSEEHGRIVERIGLIAAQALKQARAYERAVASAMTDSLTGLFNARYLFTQLSEMIASARRSGQSVGLVVIDLDRFKPINDRFGHEVGDETLRQVADLLRSALRRGDLLCRWGGDEFVLLMPGADIDATGRRALELQRLVERATLLVVGGEPISVGMSAGIASYPEDGAELQAILSAADSRMYDNKRSRHAAARSPEPTTIG